MTLSPHEFIRRFLMHVLPKGFLATDIERLRVLLEQAYATEPV